MQSLSQHVRRLPAEAGTGPSGQPRWLLYLAWLACLFVACFVAVCAPIAGGVFAAVGIGQPVVGFLPAAVAALVLAVGGVAVGLWARTSSAARVGFALSAAGVVVDVALVVFFYWVLLHPDYYMGVR